MASHGWASRGLHLRLWAILICLGSLPAVVCGVEPLQFKPGFNIFSRHDDIQIGKENAAQIDKEVHLVHDPEVLRYVGDLGKKMASYAPDNAGYPFSFKVINSGDINAFALPGGFIYVNRASIESAQDEAQLAGVISHEIGHVVMRHGTHEATQMALAKYGLGILSGWLGDNDSLSGQLAQLGIGLGVQSLFLRNSRSAESQADAVGTYMLYRAGYDPHALAQFFEIIEKKYPQKTIQFFSDHPNPENRIKNVDLEIGELGPPKQYQTDNPEFEAVKRRLQAMPLPPKAQQQIGEASQPPSPPSPPSPTLVDYRGQGYTIRYPDNWAVKEGDSMVTMAPKGGILSGGDGDSAQAYGASISKYQPDGQNTSNWGLVEATQQLIETMRQANPNLRVLGQTGKRLQAAPAFVTEIENDSPLQGQKERDWLITTRAGQSMLFVIFVAPESDYEAYRPSFEAMLESLKVGQ
jgi:Peptidase family M48